jgi:ribose 5-phosphate isomerase B
MIIIGGDQYTIDIMTKIRTILDELGESYEYHGSLDEDDIRSLPDFIEPVCRRVNETGSLGILACGTGMGVAIGANKLHGIRAALCRKSVDGEWARKYDNANILCLSSWDTDNTTLRDIITRFIRTPFQNEKIMKYMETMDNWK